MLKVPVIGQRKEEASCQHEGVSQFPYQILKLVQFGLRDNSRLVFGGMLQGLPPLDSVPIFPNVLSPKTEGERVRRHWPRSLETYERCHAIFGAIVVMSASTAARK